MAQGGDITHLNGQGGESLHNFGGTFDDECLDNPHYGPGNFSDACPYGTLIIC